MSNQPIKRVHSYKPKTYICSIQVFISLHRELPPKLTKDVSQASSMVLQIPTEHQFTTPGSKRHCEHLEAVAIQRSGSDIIEGKENVDPSKVITFCIVFPEAVTRDLGRHSIDSVPSSTIDTDGLKLQPGILYFSQVISYTSGTRLGVFLQIRISFFHF